MKLAALLVSLLMAVVRCGGGEDAGVVSINGDFVTKCYNTEVIDVGAAGFRKWTMFTYWPRAEGDLKVEMLSIDLDGCIANDRGSLKWQDQ